MTGAPAVYNELHTLTLVMLTSLATVIGSGILALPITLYETDLGSFLGFFTLALLGQVAVVYVMVELMQHASLRARAEAAESAARTIDETDDDDTSVAGISLYTLARYYLPTATLRTLFYIATFMSLIAILVSYGLAGPQAVYQTISPSAINKSPPLYIFALYWLAGTIAVLVFLDVLLPVFGSFTVLKGALFAAVIVIVCVLPQSARPISVASLFGPVSIAKGSMLSRWAAPFLMSCVALGGLPNTLCVTYALLPKQPTARNIMRFRNAVILALVICYVLNVGWVFTVLQVVPRRAAGSVPSLENANMQGQISTVPLLATLNANRAVSPGLLRAVDMIVELFILVSTGVSYFVMSAGLKNFIDGFASDFAPLVSLGVRRGVRRWSAYAVCFGTILLLVVGNPKGFISALTRFTSLMMNLQCGLLLFVMLYFCRRQSHMPSSEEAPLAALQAPPALVRGDVSYDTLPGKTDGNVGGRPPLQLAGWQGAGLIALGAPYFLLACALAAFGPMLGIHLSAHE